MASVQLFKINCRRNFELNNRSFLLEVGMDYFDFISNDESLVQMDNEAFNLFLQRFDTTPRFLTMCWIILTVKLALVSLFTNLGTIKTSKKKLRIYELLKCKPA